MCGTSGQKEEEVVGKRQSSKYSWPGLFFSCAGEENGKETEAVSNSTARKIQRGVLRHLLSPKKKVFHFHLWYSNKLLVEKKTPH